MQHADLAATSLNYPPPRLSLLTRLYRYDFKELNIILWADFSAHK